MESSNIQNEYKGKLHYLLGDLGNVRDVQKECLSGEKQNTVERYELLHALNFYERIGNLKKKVCLEMDFKIGTRDWVYLLNSWFELISQEAH